MRRNKIAEYSYILAFILYFIYYWITGSQLPNQWAQVPGMEVTFLQIAVVLFIAKLLLTCYEHYWEIILIVCLIVLGVIVSKNSGDMMIFYNMLVLCGMKNVDIKKVFKVMLICIFIIITAGMTYILCKDLNLIVMIQDYGRGAVETRYNFIWSHPNSTPQKLTIVMAIWLVLYDKKSKWWTYAVFIYLDLLIYILSKSRTGFICMSLLIALFIIYHFVKQLFKTKFMMWVMQGIVLFCVIFSVFGVYMDKVFPVIYENINQKLTGRMYISHEYVFNNGYSILGQNLDMTWLYFDMGTTRMFVMYGVILGILLLLGTLVSIRMAYREQKYEYVILLVVFSVYNVVEAGLAASLDLRWIIIGFFILNFAFTKKKREEKKKCKMLT